MPLPLQIEKKKQQEKQSQSKFEAGKMLTQTHTNVGVFGWTTYTLFSVIG
jgi:hypothetical protein